MLKRVDCGQYQPSTDQNFHLENCKIGPHGFRRISMDRPRKLRFVNEPVEAHDVI
jgi:hypothetical protein